MFTLYTQSQVQMHRNHAFCAYKCHHNQSINYINGSQSFIYSQTCTLTNTLHSVWMLTYCDTSAEWWHLPCALLHTGHSDLILLPNCNIPQCDSPIAPNANFLKSKLARTLVKHVELEVTALSFNLKRKLKKLSITWPSFKVGKHLTWNNSLDYNAFLENWLKCAQYILSYGWSRRF